MVNCDTLCRFLFTFVKDYTSGGVWLAGTWREMTDMHINEANLHILSKILCVLTKA